MARVSVDLLGFLREKLGSGDVVRKVIDATNLSPTLTIEEARGVVRDVVQYGFYCALLPPHAALLVVREALDSGVRVCSVSGFPYGYAPVKAKVSEIEELASADIAEIDAVINVSLVRSHLWERVEEEIGALVDAAHSAGALLKLIVEAPLLSDAELPRVAEIARRAGVDYLKTSTGVMSKGGDPYTVWRLSRVSGGIPVKAAGGIRTWLDAALALAAGASRIGASSYVRIVETTPT